jgi:uncharacterized protein YjdB
LHLRKTIQLEIEITPADAANQDVIWRSSNPNTAIVDQNGNVTAMEVGTTIITVTTVDGGFVDECFIRVIQPVTGIRLNKTAITLQVSGVETLVATVPPQNASIKDVEWESDDTAIATVDANGKVTGIAAGIAIITVTTLDGGFTAECEVTVVAAYISPTGITVMPKTLSLDRGKFFTLEATITPAGANPTITWSSNNTAIATVDATGEVEALAAGKVTITAKTVNGYSATCAVTVTIPIDTILFIPDECQIALKGSKVLKAIIEPADASNKTFIWSSSDPTIATVTAAGIVTAKTIDGEVEIYATNTASGKVGVCYVTVGSGGKAAPTTAEGTDVEDITIYPNPTSGELTIENGELKIENVEVFDVIGRMYHVETLRATSLQLDISHLPTGIYFVRIQTENGKIITRKVVKN